MSLRTLMLFAAIFALAPTAGIAQEPPAAGPTAAPKKGFTLKDRDGKKLGTIDLIRADGIVTFIRDMRLYRVPLSTVTTNGRTSTTSMSWEEIRK